MRVLERKVNIRLLRKEKLIIFLSYLQKKKQRKPKKRTYPKIIKELSYIVSPLFTNNAVASVFRRV